MPGTTILIGLGAILRAAGMGFWAFWPIWLAAAVGAILGDWISYWIGHRYKEHVLSVWPISRYRAQMDKALGVLRPLGRRGRSSSAASWDRSAQRCRSSPAFRR